MIKWNKLFNTAEIYKFSDLEVHQIRLARKQCCGSGSESGSEPTGSTCFWASWIQIRIH
jgi:hypothetical protein